MDLEDYRSVVMDTAEGDENSIPTVTTVAICVSSVSLTANDVTIHIPWEEVARWLTVLAAAVQKSGE